MKILFVTMQFGRSYTQGTERYVASLGACLRARDHEVGVLAGDPLGTDPPMPLGQCFDEKQKLFAYPTRGWMSMVGEPPERIEDWLEQYKPDILHLNTPAHIGVGSMIAARRLGIPVAVTTHDFWWVCPKGILLRPDKTVCDGTPGWATCARCMAGDHDQAWVRALSRLPRVLSPALLGLYFVRAMSRGMPVSDMGRWLERRRCLTGHLDSADHVIFPSKAIGEVIQPWLSQAPCSVIPNGLTAEWFENPQPPRTVEVEPEALTVGYAGAIAPHKGPHLLMEAARLLGWSKTRIKVAGPVGDRVYEERVRKAARGLNVEFVGSLSANAMPGFLRSLDVLALTSIWPENCPYAVLEAQAGGVPVVGPSSGGVVELIGDKRLLFEPGSVQGLAAALEFVRCQPHACRSDQASTVEAMTDAVERIYRDVTAS